MVGDGGFDPDLGSFESEKSSTIAPVDGNEGREEILSSFRDASRVVSNSDLAKFCSFTLEAYLRTFTTSDQARSPVGRCAASFSGSASRERELLSFKVRDTPDTRVDRRKGA